MHRVQVKWIIFVFACSLLVDRLLFLLFNKTLPTVEATTSTFLPIIGFLFVYTIFAPVFEELSFRYWLKASNKFWQSVSVSSFIIDSIITISAVIGAWNYAFYKLVADFFIYKNVFYQAIEYYKLPLGVVKQYIVLFLYSLGLTH